MCGILGYSHIAKGLPAGVLMTALRALAHRGPDHEGAFCSEQISLGATRLCHASHVSRGAWALARRLWALVKASAANPQGNEVS